MLITESCSDLRSSGIHVVHAAHYTHDLVYERIAPGLLRELESRSSRNEKGFRKAVKSETTTMDTEELLERVYEEVSRLHDVSTETRLHLDRARDTLAAAMNEKEPTRQATLIETVARHLDGIQEPDRSRINAHRWVADLRTVL